MRKPVSHMSPCADLQRGKTFLRAWRRFKGLTQEDAAGQLEIDRTTLGRIENGKIPYNQDLLEKLAMIYQCRPEDLIAVDPIGADAPKLVYDRLKRADPNMQKKALDIIEALLKAS